MRAALRLVKNACRELTLPAGAIFLFAGVALLWTIADTAFEYLRALDVPAVVAAKDRIRADRDANPGTRHVVRYRIALPNGAMLEAHQELPREKWEATAVGSEHRVRLVPQARRVLPAYGLAELAGACVLTAMAVAFALIGGGLARAPAGRLLRQLRLLRRGTSATATVLEVFATATALNRVTLWKLRYGYRDPAGGEHEAESGFLRPQEAQQWTAGAVGRIRYDPARFASSLWLGRDPD